MGLLVNIDNGGTLTDICAFDGERVVHAKTLTTPHDLTECLMAGLETLGENLGWEGDLVQLVAAIDHLRYSTTQGTNAIAQRKGPRLGLLVANEAQATAIREAAPELFAGLVDTRWAAIDGVSTLEAVQSVRALIADGASRLVICLDGDRAPDAEADLRRALYAAFPRHLLGAVPLLFSTDLAPGADPVRRAWSGLVNAFLHPSMEQFLHHAEDKLRRHRIRNPLLVFRNDGGSTRVSRTIALHTYSSGPRGGAVGAAVLARHYGFERFVSIDIGGTTTDLAIFEKGEVAEHRFGDVDGAPIAFPVADVRSVAVGGGSVLSVAEGEIRVGPESMGALPGPACFGRGGTAATMTDVMLLAGILDPDSYFGGKLTLDRERAEKAVRAHIADPLGIDLDQAIASAMQAYDGKIAHAIADLAGDGAIDAMIAFGGAGPMSACGIAEKADIGRVLVPRFAAVFSAFGIGFSPVRHDHAEPVSAFAPDQVERARSALEKRAARAMESEGFALDECELRWRALVGSGDEAQSLPLDQAPADAAGLVTLEVVRAIPSTALGPASQSTESEAASTEQRAAMGGMPLYRLEALSPADGASGPCLVEEQFFTAWIRPGWRFAITGNHDLLVEREGA
ncbi:MAG: hydantoinase/oxoprolinase family protein [Parasphingopyxis sp.]|uniref:hydantoinase/oxoprolinase family protein n=1 Tax=Parasphingopyxis sp. TaxID=1920299 RepID=UPI003F9FF6E2